MAIHPGDTIELTIMPTAFTCKLKLIDVLSDGDVVQYIQMNYNPMDFFTFAQLDAWAKEYGYTCDDEADKPAVEDEG